LQGAALVPLIDGQLSATISFELVHPPAAVFACELHAVALPSLRIIMTFVELLFAAVCAACSADCAA
jgi:hypothetical protein